MATAQSGEWRAWREDVARAALDHALPLLQEWLPAGRVEGRSYKCGSLGGDKGRSLTVWLDKGNWKDFGSDEKGGNLVALYACVRGIEYRAANEELAERFRVEKPKLQTRQRWVPVSPVPDFAPYDDSGFPRLDFRLPGDVNGLWSYLDAEGQLLYHRVRIETPNGKEFRPITFCTNRDTGEVGWQPVDMKSPRPLYGLELFGMFADDAPVLFVEGEKTADAARILLPDWLVVTAGSSSISGKNTDFAPLLARKGRIAIWPDADAAGLRMAVGMTLVLQGRAEIVQPDPSWRPGWDLADALAEGWDTAKTLDYLEAHVGKPSSGILGRGNLAIGVEPMKIEWLWPNYLPLGKLSDLQGDPGQGKSAVTASLAAIVSSGGKWPTGEQCKADGVIMVSGEDDLADTIVPRLMAAGANRARILTYTLQDDIPFELPRDIELLETQAKQLSARLIIIDPLDQFVSDEIDTNKNQSIRKLLAQLARLADKLSLCIIVVRHLNKDAKTKTPMYRGGGSIGMNAASRQVFLVGSAPDDKDLHVLAHVKGNCAAPPQSLGYRLEGVDLDEAPEINTVRVVWTGPVDVEGWQLLEEPDMKAKRIGQGEKVKVVKEALEKILANGSMPEEQVEARIQQMVGRVSHGTIFAARKQAGVTSKKKGYGGTWMWTLKGSNDSLVNGVDGAFDDEETPF